jgi:UDP-3-O-[3-hydroxymyristoyl] glucosamine N-acyltransferase
LAAIVCCSPEAWHLRTIGDYVMIGGHSGTTDNVTLGEGAQIGAWSR